MERLDNTKLKSCPLQQHIVDEISRGRDIAIVGGPGTGKTVLAMSGMGLDSNKKQILLTYSNPLSSMIKGCNVKSNTMHSFCWNLGKEMELKLGDFKDEYADGEIIDANALRQVINREYGYVGRGCWPQWEKLTTAYKRLNDKNKKEIRYNDIFVDEGQDLPDEAFKFLRLIADHLIVTFDDAQEVGKEKDTDSKKLMREAGVDCNRILRVLSLETLFYDLIDNFRNTLAIERVAKLFYNNYGSNNFSLRVETAKRAQGSKPKVVFSELNQKLFDDIADSAYQSNKQVGIIIPDIETFKKAKEFLVNTVAYEFFDEARLFYKCGEESNMNNSNDLNQAGVFLVTYQTSKGMEFDDVYLLDCQKNNLQSPADKNRFYVAATRAKETLTFVFDCEYNQSYPVLDIIKKNEDYFDILREV